MDDAFDVLIAFNQPVELSYAVFRTEEAPADLGTAAVVSGAFRDPMAVIAHDTYTVYADGGGGASGRFTVAGLESGVAYSVILTAVNDFGIELAEPSTLTRTTEPPGSSLTPSSPSQPWTGTTSRSALQSPRSCTGSSSTHTKRSRWSSSAL
mmetsp:Transcript_8076/g.26848  ORF Transcript_8076/g.26848 Transcript_8076/m.26848 type:complete len:152 (+) Transcript_8076:240-695(+)